MLMLARLAHELSSRFMRLQILRAQFPFPVDGELRNLNCLPWPGCATSLLQDQASVCLSATVFSLEYRLVKQGRDGLKGCVKYTRNVSNTQHVLTICKHVQDAR
jgi:hypothetical protein